MGHHNNGDEASQEGSLDVMLHPQQQQDVTTDSPAMVKKKTIMSGEGFRRESTKKLNTLKESEKQSVV